MGTYVLELGSPARTTGKTNAYGATGTHWEVSNWMSKPPVVVSE